jgi:hypothetical protein
MQTNIWQERAKGYSLPTNLSLKPSLLSQNKHKATIIIRVRVRVRVSPREKILRGWCSGPEEDWNF